MAERANDEIEDCCVILIFVSKIKARKGVLTLISISEKHGRSDLKKASARLPRTARETLQI